MTATSSWLKCTSKLREKRDPTEKEHLVIADDFNGADDDVLPLWRKLCFAVGGAPYQMTNTVFGFFMSIFLLEVAEISPSYVSVIVFGGKVWDAITDPLCGYLVSKSKTRFGKYRPWILFSTPFACVSYFLVWYVPDISDEAKLAYYFVLFCIFQGFLTGLHVPYTSLTMVITGKQSERDSVTAYRMASEAVGVLAGAVGQGFLVNAYRTAGECGADGESATPSPSQLEDQKWSYIVGSIVMIAVYIFCSLTVFFGSKEKEGLLEEDKEGFFTGLRMVLTYKPYLLLGGSFLFLSLALAIIQGNLALYVTHTLDMADQFSYFMVALLVSSIGAVPVWQRILLKFGKKTAYAAGMIIFIPILLSQLYIEKDQQWYYVVLVLAGFSVAVALLLPWSMLPDVIDLFMLDTGQRKDAIFYSFYVFFNKLAIGLGLGISQIVLEVGGYKSGECRQSASVALALRCLIVPGPVLFILIALLFLWRYPINEERRKRIREIMEEKRKAKEKKSRQKNEEDVKVPREDIITSASYETISNEYSTEF